MQNSIIDGAEAENGGQTGISSSEHCSISGRKTLSMVCSSFPKTPSQRPANGESLAHKLTFLSLRVYVDIISSVTINYILKSLHQGWAASIEYRCCSITGIIGRTR